MINTSENVFASVVGQIWTISISQKSQGSFKTIFSQHLFSWNSKPKIIFHVRFI